MPVLTKLIFGMHTTWDKATVAVTGTPADPATVLTVVKKDVATPATVPYDVTAGTWSIQLEPGDYLFRIDVSGKDQWWNDPVSIAVTDHPDITFVFHGPETEPTNSHQTLAWTNVAAATGVDPKDPWPPPAQVAATLPLASFDWHKDTLHDARVNLMTPKGL